MRKNGIVAAGDISNKADSFEIKRNSTIKYYTFIEIFASNPDKADLVFTSGLSIYNKLKEYRLLGSVNPHAPYSMSDPLWDKLQNFAKKNPSIWSLHNQESEEENLLFLNRSGELASLLSKFNPYLKDWTPPGLTSLQYIKKNLKAPEGLLLVHNTFTTEDDLKAIEDIKNKTTLVLCPNSNLYIENKLPDIPLLNKSGFNIALGTDSLASNTQLSVLDEMKTIRSNFNIDFNILIKWATLNGANALGFGIELGSISKGKKPGLNLIRNFDFQNMQLTDKSTVTAII